MRVGFIVDGKTELASFPTLLPKALVATEHQYARTTIAQTHAAQPIDKVVAACRKPLVALEGVGAEFVVVVFDMETCPDCPGTRAEEIRSGVQVLTALPVRVALKNTMLENWLVADIGAIRQMPGRFDVSKGLAAIGSNRADQVDALGLMRRAAIRRAYDKLADGRQVLDRADPAEMGKNSRSFRRFLRVIDHLDYTDQSRRPGS